MTTEDQEATALLLRETFKDLEDNPAYKEFVPLAFDLITSRFEFAYKTKTE